MPPPRQQEQQGRRSLHFKLSSPRVYLPQPQLSSSNRLNRNRRRLQVLLPAAFRRPLEASHHRREEFHHLRAGRSQRPLHQLKSKRHRRHPQQLEDCHRHHRPSRTYLHHRGQTFHHLRPWPTFRPHPHRHKHQHHQHRVVGKRRCHLHPQASAQRRDREAARRLTPPQDQSSLTPIQTRRVPLPWPQRMAPSHRTPRYRAIHHFLCTRDQQNHLRLQQSQ